MRGVNKRAIIRKVRRGYDILLLMNKETNPKENPISHDQGYHIRISTRESMHVYSSKYFSLDSTHIGVSGSLRRKSCVSTTNWNCACQLFLGWGVDICLTPKP